MENNICIIHIKCIKFKINYLNILILILIYSIPEICFSSNEKNILTNSNHVSKKFKDPTMPKTLKSNLNNNQFNNNSNDSDYNEEEPLKLSIIMIKDSDKTVTINNQILREQDQIDGYKIIKIEPNKVLLKDLNTETNDKFYSRFKKLLSSNKQPTVNNNHEKFIELSLPKIIIKEPIEN